MTLEQFESLKLSDDEKVEITDIGYYYRDDEIEEYYFGEVLKKEYTREGQSVTIKDKDGDIWKISTDTRLYDRITLVGVEGPK